MTRPVLRQVHNIGRRRAWVIWLVGLSVYVLAVFHRTSLGVAGLLAAERFHINAAQLATFTVVQLTVYAAMQIPVGVLIDRFGSKRLMFTGLTLMTVGQFWFAFAGSFPVGIAARVLLGAGDAMIFTSLLRLVAVWFRVKQAPFVTQLTGMVGQVGAIAAAAPLAAALATWGWTKSFATAASIGVVLGVLLLLLVKDSPYRGEAVERIKVRALARTLGEVWGNPGTQLGLWVHFTAQFGATVFTMLWGYPFLVSGEGLSPQDGVVAARHHDPHRDGRRAARGRLHRPGALPALAAGARHRAGDRHGLGRDPALARAGPALAARAARRRDGDGWARARWSGSTWPAPSTRRTASGARPGWSTSAASRHPWSPSR